MNLTTDDSMIYGFATAYETFDNLKFTPENATTILVERELLTELAQARQAVERIRELHLEDKDGYCELCTAIATPDGSDYLSKYPCQTIQALDGEN